MRFFGIAVLSNDWLEEGCIALHAASLYIRNMVIKSFTASRTRLLCQVDVYVTGQVAL
jgi:hypothetical protein